MLLREYLKEYRAKHLLTQAEFSKLSNIGVVTIRMIECGSYLPAMKTMHKIVLATDLTNEEIIKMVEDEKRGK